MLVSVFFKRVQYGYKMVVLGVEMEATDQTSCCNFQMRGVLWFQSSISSLLFLPSFADHLRLNVRKCIFNAIFH